MNTRYIRVLSGVLILTMVNMSILPQMVAAQEVVTTPDITTSWDDAVETVEETVELPEDRFPKTNNNLTVGKKEIARSLKSLSGTVEDSDTVPVTRDKDSAMIVESEGIDVDVPKKLEDGVELDFGDGLEIAVELPNADEAKKAKTVANGIVAYPGKDGSANAVQADEEGGIKMLTIIDNQDAPTEYEYKITVPEGKHIELLEDGSAAIVDNILLTENEENNETADVEENQQVVVIDTPWAKDANENPVETWFTTDGQTLTQHVMHTVEDVTYPVVADPWIQKKWYKWTYYMNRKETRQTRNYLALGGSALGYAPHPWAQAAGILSLYGWWNVNKAYNNGKCLKVSVTIWGGWSVKNYYDKKYCN